MKIAKAIFIYIPCTESQVILLQSVLLIKRKRGNGYFHLKSVWSVLDTRESPVICHVDRCSRDTRRGVHITIAHATSFNATVPHFSKQRKMLKRGESNLTNDTEEWAPKAWFPGL